MRIYGRTFLEGLRVCEFLKSMEQTKVSQKSGPRSYIVGVQVVNRNFGEIREGRFWRYPSIADGKDVFETP